MEKLHISLDTQFFVTYFGVSELRSTEVKQCHQAIGRLVQAAKADGRRMRHAVVKIFPHALEIHFVDTTRNNNPEPMMIPMHNVSLSAVDNNYHKVCYIAVAGKSRKTHKNKFGVFGFLANSQEKAAALAMTIAHAFELSYQNWRAATGLDQSPQLVNKSRNPVSSRLSPNLSPQPVKNGHRRARSDTNGNSSPKHSGHGEKITRSRETQNSQALNQKTSFKQETHWQLSEQQQQQPQAGVVLTRVAPLTGDQSGDRTTDPAIQPDSTQFPSELVQELKLQLRKRNKGLHETPDPIMREEVTENYTWRSKQTKRPQLFNMEYSPSTSNHSSPLNHAHYTPPSEYQYTPPSEYQYTHPSKYDTIRSYLQYGDQDEQPFPMHADLMPYQGCEITGF